MKLENASSLAYMFIENPRDGVETRSLCVIKKGCINTFNVYNKL